MRSIHAQRWWAKRSTRYAIAAAVAIASVGVLVAFAVAAPMDPPVMDPGPGATVTVSWLPVPPTGGATDTTYTLSYDTTLPFTATTTVVTTNTSTVIDGVDGVTYYATVQADDGSGVLSDPSAVAQATADGVAPVSAFVASPASPNGAHGWYTSVAATITAEDTGTGLASLFVNGTDVTLDPNFVIVFGGPSAYPVPLVQGANAFSFFATDIAGNIEAPPKVTTIQLDSVAPTCTLSVSASGPTSQPITASIAAGDAAPGSGVDHVEYAFLPRGTTPSGSTVWTSVAGSSASPVAPQGRLTIFARSVDVAGNISSVRQADVFLDTTAPATAIVTVPASPTGPAGSWLHAPGITLNVTDADPNTTTFYSWNDANTVATQDNSPVAPTGAGVQTLRYFSVDAAGNREATKTATFLVQDQQHYTITPTAGANGSISPSTSQVVAGASSVPFTITPASGYHIVDVLVDGVSQGAVASYTFTTVTADHTISATFAITTFTITPTAGANGSISPSTPQTVASGSDATFTIAAAAGYHVADVRVNGSSVGAVSTYTFHNVTADSSISATFALDTFTITPTAGAHGTVSPSSPQTVVSGSDATFTIAAAAGYHVADVRVDGSSVGAVRAYTFHNVTGPHTISATFAFTLIPTRLTISANHSSVTHGHSMLFSGTIAPNVPNGSHIAFYVMKPGSRTWVRVTTRNTYSSHHWSGSYTLRSRGTYSFRVKFAATSKYGASTSRTIKVSSR